MPCSYITGCPVCTPALSLHLLDFSQNEIEAVDPRGRTPLHLAVSLGHLESVRVLLRHGAEVTKENSHNWTGGL